LVPEADALWKCIYKHFGYSIVIKKTGCCGMAGNYGYQAENYVSSQKIYDLSWKSSLENLPDDDVFLATGFSCRSQVARFDKKGKNLVHPVVYLDNSLQNKG
jgi:Fe-S oxidoreductase